MPQNIKPLTHTGITADLLRKSKRRLSAPSSGGFDPNETPVIIGAGASAGGGSTPDDVSAGQDGAVVIGAHAQAGFWAWCVAIGRSAEALGVRSTSVGSLASASGDNTIAIGNASTASSPRATAVGDTATAAANDATALGRGAGAYHSHATAIGPGSTTTKDNQIMLGTASDFVEIPGNGSTNGFVMKDTATGTRYLVQITAAALVLNAAP